MQMLCGQGGFTASKRLNEDSAFMVVMLNLSVHRGKGGKIIKIYRLTQTGKHLVQATATHLHDVQKQNVKMHLHNRAVWLCTGDFSAV